MKFHVQPLFDHHQPSPHSRAVPRRQPLRRGSCGGSMITMEAMMGSAGDFPGTETLSSAHDRAPSLRLHRTVSAVEGGAAAFRPVVGPRNKT